MNDTHILVTNTVLNALIQEDSNVYVTNTVLNALIQEDSNVYVTNSVLNVLVSTPTLTSASPNLGSIVDTNEYIEVAFSSVTEQIEIRNTNEYIEIAFSSITGSVELNNTNEYVEVAFKTKPQATVSQLAVEVLASIKDKKIRRDITVNY